MQAIIEEMQASFIKPTCSPKKVGIAFYAHLNIDLSMRWR
jgi:hypothetical protein